MPSFCSRLERLPLILLTREPHIRTTHIIWDVRTGVVVKDETMETIVLLRSGDFAARPRDRSRWMTWSTSGGGTAVPMEGHVLPSGSILLRTPAGMLMDGVPLDLPGGVTQVNQILPNLLVYLHNAVELLVKTDKGWKKPFSPLVKEIVTRIPELHYNPGQALAATVGDDYLVWIPPAEPFPVVPDGSVVRFGDSFLVSDSLGDYVVPLAAHETVPMGVEYAGKNQKGQDVLEDDEANALLLYEDGRRAGVLSKPESRSRVQMTAGGYYCVIEDGAVGLRGGDFVEFARLSLTGGPFEGLTPAIVRSLRMTSVIPKAETGFLRGCLRTIFDGLLLPVLSDMLEKYV